VTPTTTSRLNLNKVLAEDIVKDVRTTFQMMFRVAVRDKPYYFEKESTILGDLSGIIEMNQEKKEAVLILTFPRDTIHYIVNQLNPNLTHDLDQASYGYIGELTNVVYGMLKKTLNDKGFQFKPSIPTVVSGQNSEINETYVDESVIIPFDTEAGPFFVRVSVQPGCPGSNDETC